MATSRITIRTIDYHKFRSLVIERDGVGDELRQRCDRDIGALCDAVQRLYDRRDRFDDDHDDRCAASGRDLARFGEICGWYKLILENRRVRSLDVRLRSCWWQVDSINEYFNVVLENMIRASVCCVVGSLIDIDVNYDAHQPSRTVLCIRDGTESVHTVCEPVTRNSVLICT